jgi:undecaprenyl diphosphate synthase
MQKTHVPKHVALIMDGNRRWAKKHGLFIAFGHRNGTKTIEPIIEYAKKINIPYLTFWAFSTENWHRDKKEVQLLLQIFRETLNGSMIKKFEKNGVRFHALGNIAPFPDDIKKRIADLKERTKNNSKITVNFALNYGGHDEIIRAINKWKNEVSANNRKLDISKDEFGKYLDTAGQPDPDLIIRTGGVTRLSGFMLWQSEYSEFYFTEVLWPDFTVAEFQKALDDLAIRQRRFGR